MLEHLEVNLYLEAILIHQILRFWIVSKKVFSSSKNQDHLKKSTKILKKKADVVVLDPPRKGLSPDICREINRFKPQFVVYISCNPSTLQRDLKMLLSRYVLEDITLYDFFPHTPHIESMTVLRIR